MTAYASYKLEDFLTDEAFRDWAKGTADEASRLHWQQVIATYPGHRMLIEQAATVIKGLSQPAAFSLDTSRQLSWEEIELRIHQEKPAKRFSWIKYVAAAAMLAGLVTTIALRQGPATVWKQSKTLAAQRQRLVLPDASVVILGANSALSWHPDWKQNQVREVWLQGEASFEVNHLNKDINHVTNHQRFLVHIENGVTVEVLGTVFLVRNRRGNTIVSLESGSVKVDLAGKKEQQLVLTPGQTVELRPRENTLSLLPQKESMNPLWRTGNLQLNNTSVLEIVQTLEDNYGKKVNIESPELLDKRVDGVMPLNNEKQAIMALSSILGADIQEEANGTITLRKN